MLKKNDQELYEAIELEKKRQLEHLELIASENYVSDDVLEPSAPWTTAKGRCR